MKIGVCIKQVIASDAPLRFDPSESWVLDSDAPLETNEADLCALEEALRLRDEQGGEVIVISLGPDRVIQVIRDGLARGADRGIHVVHEAPHLLEPLQLSSYIAEAVRAEKIDLVLTGGHSSDNGYAQSGVILAEMLGHPHSSLVVEIDWQPEAMRVRREIEGGAYQWSVIPLPCTLCIQSGINKPRYAGMKGILSAKKKDIHTVHSQDLEDMAIEASFCVQGIYIPEHPEQVSLIKGDSQDIYSELADKLKKAAGIH